MNLELLRIIPTFMMLAATIALVFFVHSQDNLISELINDIGILEHNQKVLQLEIDSMTNSSQVIDGFNMTSQKCASGYLMHLGSGGMYHCDREKTI